MMVSGSDGGPNPPSVLACWHPKSGRNQYRKTSVIVLQELQCVREPFVREQYCTAKLVCYNQTPNRCDRTKPANWIPNDS